MIPSATFNTVQWQSYCGDAVHPAQWLSHWNWDPILLAGLACMVLASLRVSRATANNLFVVAAMIFVLFVTPLCSLGSSLFLARAVHHLALTLALAPLLIALIGAEAFPRMSLKASTALQTSIFWAWHVPLFYEKALSSDLIFWTMQLSITITAAIWWVSIGRVAVLEKVAGLLAQMVLMGILGALLVFAGRALYAPHWFTTAPWGLTPLEDQQIAGLIMWVVGGGIYLLVASAFLWRHLAPSASPRPA